jgi:hypothetical protein
VQLNSRISIQTELKFSFSCSLKNYVSADELSVSGERFCSMDLFVASVVRIRACSVNHFAFYVGGRNINCPLV